MPPTNPLSQFLDPGYASSVDQLQASAADKENDAMEKLRLAMQKQADVSPTQGFAAALLAAIPTIGGYVMGSRNKMPSMPEGTWAKDFGEYSKMAGQVGGAAGINQGAAVGQQAAGGYLASLDADRAQANDANLKMSGILLQQAGREDQQANQLLQAGLGQRSASNMENQRFEHDKQLLDIKTRNDPDAQPPSEEEIIAVGNRLAGLLGPNAKDDDIKNLITQLQGAKTKKDLNYAENVMTRSLTAKRKFSSDTPIALPAAALEAGSVADSMPVAVQRTMELYDNATSQLKPGFFNSFGRKGLAALPANVQAELVANINTLAMTAAKAAGAGQLSNEERQAQAQKYITALEMGSLKETIARDIEVARAKTRSYYEQSGATGNVAAKQGLAQLEAKWAKDPMFGSPSGPMSEDEFIQKYLAAKARGQ